MSTWVKDFDGEGELELHRAVQKLRDEVTGIAMSQFHGHNRELSMVIAKLDEAKQWAIEWGVATGRLSLVDRREVLQTAAEIAAGRELSGRG